MLGAYHETPKHKRHVQGILRTIHQEANRPRLGLGFRDMPKPSDHVTV